MGLFDLFNKKSVTTKESTPVKSTVSESEKKYYQPDDYYKNASYAGTSFEKKVITFEERKKTCIPSNRGLYVAEILLLRYCSLGTYPGPKNGYPGFWWFEYGIRDVGTSLKTLENRGYIVLASARCSVGSLKVPELKKLLKTYEQPVSGKKADLVERVKKNCARRSIIICRC